MWDHGRDRFGERLVGGRPVAAPTRAGRPWAHVGENGSRCSFPTAVVPTARAKQLCARCTVRAECLRYALAVPDLVGYWAGTNERERRKLRAASRREKASA